VQVDHAFADVQQHARDGRRWVAAAGAAVCEAVSAEERIQVAAGHVPEERERGEQKIRRRDRYNERESV
jgi:hypothetical protein